MAFVMPEVALQRLVQIGISNLRANRTAFNCIFAQFLRDDMKASYGQAHIDKIYNWFLETKIPVLQAWSFDPTKVPSFTIHLADESEDESKAAVADYLGAGVDSELLVGVSSVSLDIGIHADKSKDHVLWLYYVLSYILYKEKMVGHDLGLQLYTFRASEYNKESKYMADNVWSRWVRFRCTVENSLEGEQFIEPTLILNVDASNQMDSEPIDIYEETLGTGVPTDIRRS
jgi:hypothetical protein